MAITVIGHRGMGPTRPEEINDDQPPENTIAAFDMAMSIGARGFECDIESLPSGELAVVHRVTLQKIRSAQDSGGIKASDHFGLAAMRQIDLGNGNRAPALEEVLQFASQAKKRAHGSIFVNLEVRDVPTATRAARMVGSFFEAKILDPADIFFSSFDWSSLAAIRHEREDLNVMPLVSTIDMFGKEAVLPDYSVARGAPYRSKIFNELGALHRDIRTAGVDMLMFDVRQQMLDYCIDSRTGLSVCSAGKISRAKKTKELLEALEWTSNQPGVPFVVHKSDHPGHVNAVLNLRIPY